MKSKRNMRLILAFEGSAYHGWQIQANHPTIQERVSLAIRKVTGETVDLVGSGRTDAGTHARAFVANFLTATMIPPRSLARALNGLLPRDIRVLSVRRVPRAFHARRSALSKTYRYQLYLGEVMPPHLLHDHCHYPYPLDIALMKRGAGLIVGRHDFASFAAHSGRERVGTIRRVRRSTLGHRGNRLCYTVEADGFLHHMVRNIVGTLLELGRGRRTLDEIRELFQRRDRKMSGFTAPARGLVLLRVRY